MSSWKKVKSLFWQEGDPEPGSSTESELSDAEFAELLASSPHSVPGGAIAAVPVSSTGAVFQTEGGSIDFQALYDVAGIPNTDEVEQLENFLSRLDASLPQASKLAAAQAFLGAIGRGKENVLEDAARKIHHVRAVFKGKQRETQTALAEEQRQVEALEAQIEQHRQRMEELNRDLEAVRQACLIEESRLQAARVFFGSVEHSAS